MPTISKWTIDLQTNTASFRKGLKGARKSAKGFGSSITRLTSGPLLKLTAALGLAGGVAGFTYLIKRQFAAVDAIAKTSDAIGIQTEKLIGLQHGAALSGVETEALTKGLIRMQRNVADANDGLSTSVRVFKKLGLETKKLSRLSPDKQLAAIADGMKGLPDSTERTAVAMQIFGRAGAQMIPMLQEGSKGLQKFQETAERLGLTLGREAAAEIEIANDAITDLKAASTGLWRTLASELAPVVKVTAGWIADMAAAARGASSDMPTLFEGVVAGAVFAASAVQQVTLAFLKLRLATTKGVRHAAGFAQALAETPSGRSPRFGEPGGPVIPSLSGPIREILQEDADRRRAEKRLGAGHEGIKPTKSFMEVYIEELDTDIKTMEASVLKFETADWGKRLAEALKAMRKAIKDEAKRRAEVGGAPSPDDGLPGMPARPGTFEQIIRSRSALGGDAVAGRGKAVTVQNPQVVALLTQMLAALTNILPIMGP